MNDAPAAGLAGHLRPESEAEREAIASADATPGAGLLVAMIERAARRQWLLGAEAGRCEVEEELGIRRSSHRP